MYYELVRNTYSIKMKRFAAIHVHMRYLKVMFCPRAPVAHSNLPHRMATCGLWSERHGLVRASQKQQQKAIILLPDSILLFPRQWQQWWRIRISIFVSRFYWDFHAFNLLIMSSSAPSRLCLLRCLFSSLHSAWFFIFFACVVLLVRSSALRALPLRLNYVKGFCLYLSDFVWKSKSKSIWMWNYTELKHMWS